MAAKVDSAGVQDGYQLSYVGGEGGKIAGRIKKGPAGYPAGPPASCPLSAAGYFTNSISR